ncbi:MAG TPA: response regulator [Terriglobales bacterium]|nr:response regulator [Terriglobales bacterium]
MVSLKLLVVEDDPASLELMSEVLSSLEAEVHPMSDSRKAATMINQEKFDGIFLDLEMPSPNGFQLAQMVRASSWNKGTPIVIVTGREERQTMREVFAIGATFFLQKPVDRQKLTILFRAVRGTLFENRRRSVRVSLQTDVTCTTNSHTERGKVWNISQGGMQVETARLRPGEAVHISFSLPGSNAVVEAEGVVIWSKAERQGIRFSKLNSQSEQHIRDFIAHLEKPEWLPA